MDTNGLIKKAQALYPNTNLDITKLQLNQHVLENYEFDGYQIHYDDDLIIIASNT